MAVVPNTKYVQGMRVKAEAQVRRGLPGAHRAVFAHSPPGLCEQPKPVEAVKLIADVPPIEVAGRTTHCDGGDGALGHPRVFINLDKKSGAPAVCGYCGKRFVTKPGSHGHH